MAIGRRRQSVPSPRIMDALAVSPETDPRELLLAADPVGPSNDDHILWACQLAGSGMFAGWGGKRFAQQRALAVRELIAGAGRTLQCVGQTKGGAPKHPSRPAYS